MNLLNTLDTALNKPVASFIKLLTQYKKNEKTVFCFVEGNEDISFYSHYLNKYFNEDVKYIVCNGKSNVLDNYKNINWKFYDKKRVLFFVDKDFDDYINESIVNDDNIFKTNYYSIENYLIDENVLKRFIIDNCNVNNEGVIDSLVNHFNSQHKNFVSHLTKISAWMIYCRMNKFTVNFNDIKLTDLFQIDKDGNFIKIKLTKFKNHFQYICFKTNSNHFNLNIIKQIHSDLLKEKETKKYLRGKYELFFMFIFLKHIIDNIVPKLSEKVKVYNKSSNSKLARPRVTLQIKEENIFQILCNKAKEPDCLKSFLQNIINMN